MNPLANSQSMADSSVKNTAQRIKYGICYSKPLGVILDMYNVECVVTLNLLLMMVHIGLKLPENKRMRV